MTVEALTVRVWRGQHWWVAQAKEAPGILTQVRRLTEVEPMIRDAAALFPEFVDDAATIPITLVVEDEWADKAAEATRRVREVEQERSRAAAGLRAVAASAREAGLTVREVAMLLGVTPGRVSALLRG